ncbi:MAG: hypothetical protein OIF56_15085 [Cohaesibacter sp.]|nr:hypothetical protein [Cohaesibacter sp.]
MPVSKESSIEWLGDIKEKLGIAPSNLALKIGLTEATLNKAARPTAPEKLSQKSIQLILLYLEELKEADTSLKPHIVKLEEFAREKFAPGVTRTKHRKIKRNKSEVVLAPHIRDRQLEDFHVGLMDIPVRGTAAGSMTGAMQLDENVIEFVRRPPSLTTAQNAFAIYVIGDSMHPEHKNGDLRFVHPDRPPKQGDSVIIETYNPSTEEKEVFIKEFVKRSGNEIICKQHNPPAEVKFIIPIGEAPEKTDKYAISVFKVLTMNELLGY